MLENMKGLLSRAKTFAMRRAVIIPAAIALVAVAIAVSVATLNTFVVHDGDTTVIHRSYASDAVKMLSANGTELNELDMLKVERTDGYRTFDVRIIPASNVDVVADGKSIKTEVRADETVAAALARAGITMNALDTVSPKAHEVVTDGAKIEVTRISVTNVVKTVAIPFEKVTKKSADMNAGKQVIKQAGVNGKKNQTYQVTKKNGVVAGQKLMKEVVVAQPKAQITEHGTRKVMSSQGGGAYAVSRGAAPGAGAPARYRKVIDVVATAYSSELISNKWTATGAVARVGLIAVDPRVIPLGTRLYITSMDGKRWVYGYAVAADTGGAIKGNKIDLFFNTEAECYDFGRQKAKVYILD